MNGSHRPQQVLAVLIAGYITLVLAADTLATRGSTYPFDWRILDWRLANGVDLFKFIAWFVVPLLIALPFFDTGYFRFSAWKKIDWYILAAVVLGGALIMVALPHVPSLSQYYRGWAALPPDLRWRNATRALLWTFSWLLGWEFMHRYLLIKHFSDAWPRQRWLIALLTVPLLEALYHVIQGKPYLECLGMGALSALFTIWVLSRRNALLPFLGHLAIEIELTILLFLT